MTWICRTLLLPPLLAVGLAPTVAPSVAASSDLEAVKPALTLELQVRYPGQDPAHLASLKLVDPSAVPDVDVDARSRNLTLDVPGRWSDLAFYGRPAPASTASARTLLSLIQQGTGSARIEEASALCFKREGDACLPAGIVRLSPCRFRRIEPHGTAQINVLVAGKNLPPGEYNGLVHVAITDQAAPVDIPLKLRVKDGPLAALLALGTGLLLSALFNGWTLERRLPVHQGKALAVALGWLFVLAAGWIALYVLSPTFGAEPSSYISLLLWGAATEALRGRALSRGARQPPIEPSAPPPP